MRNEAYGSRIKVASCLLAAMLALALMAIAPSIAMADDSTDTTGSTLDVGQIQVKDLSAATVSGVKDLAYTGKKLEQPKLKVRFGGALLQKGRDYTVVYANNAKIGTAQITITGIGEYSGSLITTFQVTPIPVKKAKITLTPKWYFYDGKKKKPSVTVKLDGKTLKQGTHYKVSYAKNRKAGQASVTITGLGTYGGTKTKSFAIKKHPSLRTSVHVAKGSWSKYRGNSIFAGSTNMAKPLSGLKLDLTNPPYAGTIKYRVYLKGKGWQKWVSDDKIAGSEKKSRKIEAVQVKLTGKMAKHYRVNYCVLTQKYGWSGWGTNGDPVGIKDLPGGITGVRVELVDKGHKQAFKAYTYRRHTLAKAKRLLNAASGEQAITMRNGKLTKDQKRALRDYIDTGKIEGFIAVNVKTGKTVAFNPDEPIFSASSVKGPCLAALCKYDAPDIAYWEPEIDLVLQNSDNNAYNSIFMNYGSSYLHRLADEVGVSLSVSSRGYTTYTPRELAKLWSGIQDYLQTGTKNRVLFESHMLGHDAYHYKVGYMYPGSWSGGIYNIGGVDGDIVFAAMTTYSDEATDVFALGRLLRSIVRK